VLTPDNIPALAGLTRCYLETGEIEQAKAALAQVPEAKRNEALVVAARAAVDMGRPRSARSPSRRKRSLPAHDSPHFK
jgi:putative thioredoxin